MDKTLGLANWSVIIIYSLIIVSIGVFTKWKQKATKDQYLKGDGKVPTVVLAVSIWATTLSAITFIAFTATVYRLDWRYWVGITTILVITPFIIKYIVPFFRKIHATTAYEYIEYRFNRVLRITTSLIFILFHISRIAIVVYIPAIAIYATTGINPYLLTVIIGVLTVIYTYFGGLKGVIWTDFIQGMVFLFGIILTIFFAVHAAVGSFWSIMGDANRAGHIFNKGSFSSTLAMAGIPIIFIGQIFNNVYQYMASQDVVQRYNGNKDVKSINKSLWINAILAVVSTALLAIVGTLIWSFYLGPDAAQNLANKGLTPADIPHGNVSYSQFALDVLPVGISGLIIASIIAASQSTIASSLSAVVSCMTVDILPSLKYLKKKVKDKLFFAKITTAVVGSLGTLIAILLVFSNETSLFNYWLGILGLFGSPVSTIFLLGIFTKKTNSFGATFGLITAFLISITLWICSQFLTTIDSLWIPIMSMPAGIITGYLASLVKTKYNKGNIIPLTIYGISLEYNNPLIKKDDN